MKHKYGMKSSPEKYRMQRLNDTCTQLWNLREMIGDKLSPLQLSVIEIFLESVDKVADNAAVLSEQLLSYILIEQKLEELDKKSADVEQRLELFLEEKETELSKLRSELAAIKAERDALMENCGIP
ncbi:hypothetical protein N656DRAFT_768399 [Canariomyces notabilis]|uniref:Uncharacterized protein n=1 Tax=Canariomyces notabilis TaxID=2074819 RepID=A0AAN6TEH5_9PEZI|nr:hypothetical protein N656DRAFT_768399 [Canariomyces arenarius]